MQKIKEIYLPVPGFENRYKVSNLGNVKSILFGERLLKPSISYNGYAFVCLTGENKTHKRFSIHRLVAITFISNPLNKREVNHIDCNKLNNCVFNLEWATPSENQLHAFKNGISSFHKNKLLGNAASVKVRKIRVAKYDLQNNLIETYDSQKDAAIANNIYPTVLGKMVKGIIKSKNFIFKPVNN